MVYWVAATLLVTVNACCVLSNLLMMPGNWLMVGSLCLFLLTAGAATGPDWTTLVTIVVLAVVGEILEAFSGAAKAKRKGASRRAVVWSLIFSFGGSIAGSFVIPIPVIGTAVGAVAGAAAGAFAGAWMGEASLGTEPSKRTEIGAAAMSGRMIGMLAKLAIGVAIFVVQFVSLW